MAPVLDAVLLALVSDPIPVPELPVVVGVSEAVPEGVVTEVKKVDVSSDSWEPGRAPPAPGLPAPGLPSPISGALVLLGAASLLLDVAT